MRRALSAVLAAYAFAACAKPVPIDLSVTISLAWLNSGEKVEVTADGTPVAVEPADQGDLRFKSSAILKGKSIKFPALRYRRLTACGWEEGALAFSGTPDAEYARGALERHDPLWLTTYLPHPSRRPVELEIDNRGGKPVVLKAGAIEVPVAEGVRRVSLSGCPAPTPLTFDGKPLGDLAPAPPDEDRGTNPWVFVDPTGKRCYSVRTYYYGRPDWGGGSKSKPVILSGATLYPQPEPVNYVLEEAPSMIMATAEQSHKNVVLQDAKCR